ncbi:MAG: hypothetical protein AMJ54_02835 [Deltaproteobacteria bacterium SG8_13]|nr:MAG: hypothetical protein AMJ54_02835 [Deltaproteobacteria bacterium SG8_13]
MNINTSFRIGLILILLALLSSCQGKLLTAKGKTVAEQKRIALQPEGTASGSWQGKGDLTVNYTTTRTRDTLQIAGDIVFQRHKLLDTFRFSLVLIDTDGSVLDVVPITSAGGRRKIEQVSFSRELPLPPDTRSFAFTYDGTTRGIGEGGSPTSFWSAPW